MKNSVRITSGIYRGRDILTPGAGTHPMGEREKIALFNMISSDLAGARVLDAYAGSGALGIEALSRGAKSCDFVERSGEAARIIKQNLLKLDILPDKYAIYKQRVADFEPSELYSVIIADPPYDDFKVDEIEHLVQFLNTDGVLVLSHPDAIDSINGLELLKTRRYARAHISIFTK